MKVTICHQALSGKTSADELDVLDQVGAVRAALQSRGAHVDVLPCGLDLERVREQLRARSPDVVFNLVECLADRGELVAVVPALMDCLGLPYTGASAEALFATSNKLAARRCLRAAGVDLARDFEPDAPHDFIVKSVWEHASRGLDAGSVVCASRVADELQARGERFGGRFFAEEYVDGREFNVGLLQSDSGPEVLPIAEIVFEDFADGRPKIVDYAAKWDTDSFEYRQTRRRFGTTAPNLERRLGRLATECWQCFELDGYARVDFRVAGDRVVVLEVNANPCLTPDAGFGAALDQAGIPFESAIERIVDRALQKSQRTSRSTSHTPRSTEGVRPCS